MHQPTVKNRRYKRQQKGPEVHIIITDTEQETATGSTTTAKVKDYPAQADEHHPTAVCTTASPEPPVASEGAEDMTAKSDPNDLTQDGKFGFTTPINPQPIARLRGELFESQSASNPANQAGWNRHFRIGLKFRYAPITYKERIALLTMECIPTFLLQEDLRHSSEPAANNMTPRHATLIDRMTTIFARAMARERLDAATNGWSLDGRQRSAAKSGDIMSSREVEAFCAGIEELHNPAAGYKVVCRRYWRFIDGLTRDDGVGGIIGASSHFPHHISSSLRTRAEAKHAKRVLIAEVEVDEFGRSCDGLWRPLADDEPYDLDL